MEAQVENAIEIAWNPLSDLTLKAQAFEFLNRLRSEPQGWGACLSLATRQPRASEVVQHVALDVVNTAIQGGKVDERGLLFIRDTLMQHARVTYGQNDQSGRGSVTIQNKLSQSFTYLFISMYNTQWQSFFDDIFALTSAPGSTDRADLVASKFCLKIISSIHDEIADVLVSRSPQEQQRDNNLKDLIRQRDVQKIASLWQDVLVRYKTEDASIIELCLATLGRWAAWTDLSLIVNESLLNLLFQSVSPGLSGQSSDAAKLRDASIHTMMELLGKKMKATDKLDLIEVLNINEVIDRLATSPSLQDMRFTSNYDTDLAELVAKLVNQTVFDIVNILDKSNPSDPAVSRANSRLQGFLPYLLRFFSDEYDEICSSVIGSITDLLTYFRKKAQAQPEYSEMLPPILQAIISKMKYDETSQWGSEDAQTDEAEFQDLRKRLHVLQQAVAAVDEVLFVNTISNVVKTSFEAFQNNSGQVDWRDMDLALYEMFLFGQFAFKNGSLYSKTKPVSLAAERLIAMMSKLVELDIAKFPHPAIHLQYMEICVRYNTFFEANPTLIPQTLENFIQFVHHNHVRVRCRSWYLFHRLVKSLRPQIGNIAQNVIQAVSDLLPIKAELPESSSDSDDMSSDENDRSADATFSSQLYLFEAIGNVCSPAAVPIESQVLYLRAVLEPLFSNLGKNLGPAQSGDERATLQVHHTIMALGTLAHGYSEWVPNSPSSNNPPPAEVSSEFARAAEIILIALESLQPALEIRTAARAAFSRFVGVLGARILPQLPRWIDGLLSKTSSKDEMAMFLRLLDQVVFGFKADIFDILNALLTPFLQRVFAGIAEPTTGTDDEIQLAELKAQCLAFLLVILDNDLGRVLVSTENQAAFESLIAMLEHLAKDDTDLPNAKMSFSVLGRMVSVWGGPDVTAASPTPTPSLPGFDQFMMERFSPLVWALPSNANFNPKDAQARQVLGEAAGLQKTIYSKVGEEYLNYLQNTEFWGMGWDATVMNEYLQGLSGSDPKKFRQYFQGLIQSLRR